MKRILMLLTALAFTLTLAQTVPAQELASSIVGVWKLSSQMRKEVASGKTMNTYGEKPTGHLIYTKGGHFTFTIVADGRKAPATPSVTDAERVDLFKSSSFGSGSYKIDGNKVIARYATSWHQLWTGKDIAGQAEVKDKTLTLTTAPFKSPMDGAEVVVVTTWERVE